jgi:hypothetical protein
MFADEDPVKGPELFKLIKLPVTMADVELSETKASVPAIVPEGNCVFSRYFSQLISRDDNTIIMTAYLIFLFML